MAVWSVFVAGSGASALGGDPVSLIERGGVWELRNGLVSLALDVRLAALTELHCGDSGNLISLAYYDTNGSPGGFTANKSAGYLRFGRHEPAMAEIVYRDDDRVDVAFTTDANNLRPDFHQPLRTEFHYVLLRDQPGFYVYWLRWHGPQMRPFHLAQTRYVIKAPRDVFDQWRVNEELGGTYPDVAERAAAERVYDATYRLPNGHYLTKYANAVPSDGHHLSGLFSTAHGTGLWQINPSNEYVNGGPTKRNLTLHEEGPILVHMVQSLHFVGRPTTIAGDWCKLYGPVRIHLNRARDVSESWTEAQEQARVEMQAWPYPWVKTQARTHVYPTERGVVSGTLRRADGGPVADTYVILGAPDPEWQYQSLGYMYWARADAAGRFRIAGVRPGQYSLFTFLPGFFGEARMDGLRVTSGETLDVGEVEMRPEEHGETVWQIGTPDRTCAEFRNGTRFREVYLYREYAGDFPDDVRFVVGRSEAARDWNYYQPGGKTWRVVFTLDERPAGAWVLTVAAAGSGYRPPAAIALTMNGTKLPELELDAGDSALGRLGNYDAYQVRTVGIAPESMFAGENVLELSLPHRSMWVMYDFLRLERPPD